MSPREFRPAVADDYNVAVRQVNPFGSFHTTTSTSTSTTTPTLTPTPTETEIETETDEPDPPTTDWGEVYYSGFSKYYSDYSEHYYHATTPAALSPTVTATMTVTGANGGTTATTTDAYAHGGSPNDHPAAKSNGLGSSAIAGIAVGSVLGLSVLGALLVWFCLRGRQQPLKDGEVEEVAHPEPPSPPSHFPLPYPENMGRFSLQSPMAGPAGPSVHGHAVHTSVAASASAAHEPSRLPSPFRQRHQMHIQAGSDDETVAFAKASNTVPAQSLADEDPPAYEETEGHRRVAGSYQGQYAPPPPSVGGAEFAAGSVSDGFRRYHEQPVQDAESKPYDPLAPGSRL